MAFILVSLIITLCVSNKRNEHKSHLHLVSRFNWLWNLLFVLQHNRSFQNHKYKICPLVMTPTRTICWKSKIKLNISNSLQQQEGGYSGVTKTYGSLLPSLSSQLRILMQELNGAVTVLPISTKTLLRQRVCGVANLRRRGFDLHTYIYTHRYRQREREKSSVMQQRRRFCQPLSAGCLRLTRSQLGAINRKWRPLIT